MEPSSDTAPRICPKCHAAMEQLTLHGVEVDRCTNCRGLWFDALEKEDLKRFKDAATIDIGDPKLGREYNKVDHIECPVCHTQMIRMVDLDQPHIWYESCPVCYGSFFDAGEFKDYQQDTVRDFLRDLFAPERK
jgi:Zn-finger nucleic acid-binding protein